MIREQKKLKAILQERGISTYKLSRECDIHSPDMYNCINGKMCIYPKWKNRIAEYLELPEEDIFEDEEE